MIVFAVLWLTATVFLVVLYTGQEDLKRNLATAQSAKNRAVSDAEERSLELVKQASERGPTMVGLLETARADTATLATGEQTDGPSAVRDKRNAFVEQLRTDALVERPGQFADASLLDALQLLYGAYRTQNALRTDTETRATALEARVTELTRRNDAQKQQLDEDAAQIKSRLTELEAEWTAYRSNRNEEVNRLQGEFENRSAQADSELTRERQRRAGLEEQYTDLQARFGQLQEKLGLSQMKPEPLSTARIADGRILMAVPGDPVVYIDRGRKDRLTLGLEFAVYSAKSGIPEDGRAKARVEVVSIADASAECRIVEVFGNEVILEDDLIANPIYDPNRPLSFLVVGDFDLDRDGRIDPSGAQKIEALVADWGGTLATELTALTDFVVLGAAPPQPRAVGDLTPEQQQAGARARDRYQRYQSVVSAANSLGVPILTQDVFIQFLGYTRQRGMK